jgi:hypothetical protein
VSFCVLFVCKCVLNYSQRVVTQSHLTNISNTKCTHMMAMLHSSFDLTSLDTMQQRPLLHTRPHSFYLQCQVPCCADTCKIVLLVTDWSLCTVAFQDYLHSSSGWGRERAVGVANSYGVQIAVGKYIFLNGYRSSFPG